MIYKPVVLIDADGNHRVFDPDELMHQMIDHGVKIYGISLEAIQCFRKHMMALGYPHPIKEEDVEGFFYAEGNKNSQWRDLDGGAV